MSQQASGLPRPLGPPGRTVDSGVTTLGLFASGLTALDPSARPPHERLRRKLHERGCGCDDR
jgi:hypothetical protein